MFGYQGSSRVREIVFYGGGDEHELYEYDIGPDESKKIKKLGTVTCMVQPTWIRSKINFFMATGSPVTFDASRWADCYGCLPDNDVQMADAIQALYSSKVNRHSVLGRTA